MRLLDLFCGAGGAGTGYHRAGFDVTGVDNKPQKHYPFEFILSDALVYLKKYGHNFDVIHASPPCQVYSTTASLSRYEHPDLVVKIRKVLKEIGKPYVIENVPGAPLENPLVLCGTMFGLQVIRHRLFETFPAIWFPPAQCTHIGRASSCKTSWPGKGYLPGSLANFEYITVCGNSYIVADGRKAMGIDWMTQRELSQAIPPAYTEWLGLQLFDLLEIDDTPYPTEGITLENTAPRARTHVHGTK